MLFLIAPFFLPAGPQIVGVVVPTPINDREIAEFKVDLTAQYQNPYDPAQVSLDATFKGPSGRQIALPGYFDEPQQRSKTGKDEVVKPTGKGGWRFRFAPTEAGKYSVHIRLTDRNGTAEYDVPTVSVRKGASNGFVTRSKFDTHFFAFQSGRCFFPVGANICWGGDEGTYAYDRWIPDYAKQNANYGRLWLAPGWNEFCLEQPEKGLGWYSQAAAFRLDYVMRMAQKDGIYLMLCLNSYNELRERDAFPYWPDTPMNKKNGGPLAAPTEFWTNAEMDRIYRNRLRYLVARYSAYRSLFAWELWNEVDLTTGFQAKPVADWHDRMARALRAIDPYKHLITTSAASTNGVPELDRLASLDYFQTHHYNNPDVAKLAAEVTREKRKANKPHYIGEIGADSAGPRADQDPEGMQIHDTMWASVGAGASGAAAPWWWDSLIEPKHLYGLFGAISRFVSDVDFGREQVHPVDVTLRLRSGQASGPPKDLEIVDGPSSWDAAAYNRPQKIQVSENGVVGDKPVAGLLHGVMNHPTLHNPLTIETNFPNGVRFEVLVGDVSGYGGARLLIKVDEKSALNENFEDPDGGTSGTTITKYARAYGADIPAGRHVVTVENIGADWFFVGYRFRDALRATSPPLLAWGAAGQGVALVWVRNERRTWRNVCVLKEKIATVPPSLIDIPVGPGKWRCEIWDTYLGKVTARSALQSNPLGVVTVELPAVAKDIAVKLVRASP